MSKTRYSSCSGCIEAALKIQMGKSEDWELIGNGKLQCILCARELKKKLTLTVRNSK